jgi:hypothetical protein
MDSERCEWGPSEALVLTLIAPLTHGETPGDSVYPSHTSPPPLQAIIRSNRGAFSSASPKSECWSCSGNYHGYGNGIEANGAIGPPAPYRPDYH